MFLSLAFVGILALIFPHLRDVWFILVTFARFGLGVFLLRVEVFCFRQGFLFFRFWVLDLDFVLVVSRVKFGYFCLCVFFD